MFKFQRILSAGAVWTDNLYLEDEHLGTIGRDNDGLWAKLNRHLKIQEINLLLAQLAKENPELLKDTLELISYNK